MQSKICKILTIAQEIDLIANKNRCWCPVQQF